MLEIEVAEKAGACFGVNRALELARGAAQSGGVVHTLGPLIHNPRVVSELEMLGAPAASTLDEVRCGTLVLRSHGTAPQVVEDARARGFDIVDATCPYVAKVQRKARELADAGYALVIVGESGHAEVEGIRAHAQEAVVAVADTPDKLPHDLPARIGVVVQTTQSQERVDAVVAELKRRVRDVHVEDTVCFATQERQQAAVELAARVDCMVVLGGKNSGNTRRLYELCKPLCDKTYHVESPEELDADDFADVSTVGITAGASTPEEQIEAARVYISEL